MTVPDRIFYDFTASTLFLNLHFGDFSVSGTQCPGSKEQELYGLEQ